MVKLSKSNKLKFRSRILPYKKFNVELLQFGRYGPPYVSLSLMLATVEALLFGVDGYEGVPEWTTFAQEAIWGAAFGAMGKVV